MREVTDIREIQQIVLNITKYIVNICEEHNLRYLLTGGTLLGAIRHQGFIPWDDDIDLCMPRPDYDKLIEILEKTDNSRFKLLQFEEGNYYYPYIKIVDTRTKVIEHIREEEIPDLGLYIDIFPLDGFGNELNTAKKQFLFKTKLCYWIVNASVKPSDRPLHKRIFYFFWNLFGKRFSSKKEFFEYYSNKLRKLPYDKSTYVCSTFGLHGTAEMLERSYFELTDAKFEDTTFKIPAGYDKYLTRLSGDYMQLPPEDQRVVTHDTTIYADDSLLS